MKKIIWLDPGPWPIYLGFCPSRKAWANEKRKKKISGNWPDFHKRGGICIQLEDKDGSTMVIVAINGAFDDPAEGILTLVHEAVHVWQYVCEAIGERSPGIETEAYTIEHFSRLLMNAYTEAYGGKHA